MSPPPPPPPTHTHTHTHTHTTCWQAAAYSLRLKLAQGLDVIEATPTVGDRRRDSELTASVEVLLQEPELVLQDPTSSLTGMALQGLLAAQVASRVRSCVVCCPLTGIICMIVYVCLFVCLFVCLGYGWVGYYTTVYNSQCSGMRIILP